MSLRKRASQIDAITEYLFVEGYADTIESAEAIAESISLEWAQEILDEARYGNLAHSFPLTPSEKRAVENIARMNRGDYSVPPGQSGRSKRSAKKVEPEQPSQPEQPKRKRRRLDFEVR
jgi:hypothetical protein